MSNRNFPYVSYPAKLPLPPDNQGDFCFTVDRKWKPYLLGAIMPLLSERTWEADERNTADSAKELMAAIMDGGDCDMITGIRLVDCELQAEIMGEWVNVADLTDCAVPGPKGDTGDTGPKGDTGDTGPSGASNDDPGPIDTDGGAGKDGQACAMAAGLAVWLIKKCLASIDVFKAGAETAKDIAESAADLLDAIPIFGAVVKSLVDFGADMAVKGDYDDIKGFIEDPDFQDEVQCKLYCEFKSKDTIDTSVINTALTHLVSWAVTLAPGLPDITFYGQAFSLFLAAVSDEQAWRRAILHQDETSDDCASLCDECPDDITFTYGTGTGPATGQKDTNYVFTGASIGSGHYFLDVSLSPCLKMHYVSSTGWTSAPGAGGSFQSWNQVDCAHGNHQSSGTPDISTLPDAELSELGLHSGTPFSITMKFVDL